MNEIEAMAGFRILLCMAKADGIIKPKEREALENALGSVVFPGELTLNQLLEESIELDVQAALITSFEARLQTYNAARAIAFADGECSKEEQKLLKRLQEIFQIDTSEDSWLDGYLSEVRSAGAAPPVELIEDPSKRAFAIEKEIKKTAFLSALCGAFPLPGLSVVTDLGVIFLQASMARQIAAHWGQKLEGSALNSLLGTIAGGVGMRLAINTLVKFVPFLGSAFGAVSSFATTWALGKVVDQYFASGGKLEPDAMKTLFRRAVEDGKAAYKSAKGAVEERGRALEPELRRLAERLRRGEISPAQYNEQILKLPPREQLRVQLYRATP